MQVPFGEFVLDLDSRELRRANEPVRLSPKAFQLLEILVTTRPRALSKADLQDRLWPDTFVVEKNLANLISEIRQALGESPRNRIERPALCSRRSSDGADPALRLLRSRWWCWRQVSQSWSLSVARILPLESCWRCCHSRT